MPWGTVRVTYTINGVVQENGADIPVDVDTEIEDHANNYLFTKYRKTFRGTGPLEEDLLTDIRFKEAIMFQIPPFEKTVDGITYGATFSEPTFQWKSKPTIEQTAGARRLKRKTIRRKRSTRRMHKRRSSRRRRAI